MFDMQKLFAAFPVIDLDDTYYLRRFKLSDAEGYHEFYNQPEVAKFLPDSMVTKNIEHATQEITDIIDAFNKKETIYWAIAQKSDDKIIGGCGFHDWNRFHLRMEIAYDLHPNYWRKGIMQKAIRAVLKFAFSYMGVVRITATTVNENDASNNLLLKLGFKYEGVLRKYKFFKGKMIDVMFFSYIINDFTRDVNLGRYN